MRISKGIKPGPRKILFIGQHGVGKSTWASQAPNPIFHDFEDSTSSLDVARFEEPCFSVFGLINQIEWLNHNQHEFFTNVIDTADWLNQILAKEVRGGKSMNDAKGGFGRGKEALSDAWNLVLPALDNLRRNRKMTTIILAHAKVTKINDPQIGQYDKYTSDLPPEIDSLLQEWADEVFFGRFKLFTRSEEIGIKKERQLASTSGEREILTCDSASASAKNRCNLPAVMEFPKVGFWPEYFSYLKAMAPKQTEPVKPVETMPSIAGLVVDGSSKTPLTKNQESMINEMESVFGG